MEYRIHLVALAAACVVVGAGRANAADYIPDEPLLIEEPEIEYSPPPYYTRVDCSVAFNGSADLRAGSPERHFIEKNGGRIETDDGWACGVGLGVRVNQHIRVDATVEYRGEFGIDGIADPTYVDPLTLTVDPISQSTAVDSVVTLFNIYWDFGHFGGITPYVGGGIGFAHNEMEDSYVAEDTSGFYTHGGSQTDFAWALMAGLGIDISPDLVLDAGYRYVNFGSASTGTLGSDGSIVPAVRVVDMDAHEIRVGVRYSFY